MSTLENEVLWDALLTVGADRAWRSSLGYSMLRVNAGGDIARLTGRYQPWPHGCGTSLQIAVEASICFPWEINWDQPGRCFVGGKWYEAPPKETDLYLGGWYKFALCPKCLAVLFSEATCK